MDITGIIAISGKPGLYKIIASNRNSLVVESLVDNRRSTALPTHKISALDDISIYTIDSDVPLREVYASMFKVAKGGQAPSHKDEMSVLKSYLTDVLADWDEDRVYNSDIKKLFQWYNILQAAGVLKEAKKEKAVAAEEEE